MSSRIGYLTGEYPRATDTFIQREVEELRSLGLDVETFSIRPPGAAELVGPEQAREKSRTSYLLPPSMSGLLAAHLRLLLTAPRRYLSALWLSQRISPDGFRSRLYHLFYFLEAGLLGRQLQRKRITHLHNHFANSSCTVAMLASTLTAIPFSFTVHGPAIFFEPRRWRLDTKASRARFVACISQFCRSQVKIFAPPEAWNRLHVVHCGVDPAEFRARDHVGRAKRLLFVGRLAAVKGLPVLLEAFSRLKEDELVLDLVGDGPDRERLSALAARLGVADRVRFHGYLSRRGVRTLLGECDVFVMASFAEGVPVVLMEAMAAGLPVVATRIAGVPELVEDGVSGLLVSPGDPEPLVTALEKVVRDPELRRDLGRRGREVVEKEFDVARETARLADLLQGRTPAPGR